VEANTRVPGQWQGGRAKKPQRNNHTKVWYKIYHIEIKRYPKLWPGVLTCLNGCGNSPHRDEILAHATFGDLLHTLRAAAEAKITCPRRAFPVLEPEPMLAWFLQFAVEHYARND
jgi:hypothetical protein